MPSLKKIALATALSLATITAQAGFVDSFVETLPGGASPYPDAGFIGNQLNGMHDLIENGRTGLLVPAYTNHPAWDYDNRYEENGYPFGAGITRGIIDERGNERMMYLMFFRDSHYEIEPIMGYAWVARYPIANTGFHLGAGYTAGLTFRQDYSWVPIPVPLPLVSAGTDWFNVYATYIPFSNVFFFFSKIEFDDQARRFAPWPESKASAWANTTEVYAQGSWVKTDLSSGDGDFPGSFTLSSESGYKFGIRQFLDRHWALDLSYQQSDHDLKSGGQKVNEYRLTNTNLMLQYHFEVLDSMRVHVGGGAAYSQLKSRGEADYKEHNIIPVVQTGFTWAVTDHLRVLGDMTVNFPFFRNVKYGEDGQLDGRFKPANTSFNLGVGYAF